MGDVGLELSRTPFYEKELTLLFARSYGPGRYEREYEEYGVDYPAGQVRWTEGRNFEAVLDLIASGRLQVADLVTHTFPIAGATGAYELIESRREPYLAIALTYPETQPDREPPLLVTPPRASSSPGVGWIGAGGYSTGVLLPAFAAAGFDRLVAVASASGLSARRVADRAGFEKALSSADEVIADPDVEVVVIATPHDTHADYTVRALQAGKHVWCEKPLALSMEELNRVEAAWRESGCVLMVGHNRRWAPHVLAVAEQLRGPAVVTYRVSAGPVPARHWYADRRQGGRLLGEVCHFVDTCAALVRSEVVDVRALAGPGASSCWQRTWCWRCVTRTGRCRPSATRVVAVQGRERNGSRCSGWGTRGCWTTSGRRSGTARSCRPPVGRTRGRALRCGTSDRRWTVPPRRRWHCSPRRARSCRRVRR